MSEDNKIFVDTDFLSCFLKENELGIINKLYPDYKIYVPQFVLREILDPYYRNHREIKNKLNIERGNQTVIDVPPIEIDTEEHNFFLRLNTFGIDGHKIIGDGEAEAITLTKFRGGILASNNLTDVLHYVKMFKIKHITTSDVLLSAYERYYLTKDRIEEIWSGLLSIGTKLPASSFGEYLKKIGEKNA